MLGTSVMTPTFRYHPAVVAQAFGTLACLYPDWVMLGIGTGESLNEVAVSRLEWPEFKERFARLREAVALIKSCGPASVALSRGTSTRPTTPRCMTARRVRSIYIAAGGPVVASYAGRAGDGFICTSGKGPELYGDKLIPAVDEGLAAAGRAGGSIDRMIEIKLLRHGSPNLALENTAGSGRAGADARAEARPERPRRRWRPPGDALSIDQVASRWIVAARPRVGARPDPAVRRPRFRPSGLPRTGPRPVQVPHLLCRRCDARAARGS